MKDTYKNQYKVDDKRLVSLSVYNVGYQHCAPLHQWGPGVRDHYLIHYIVSGYGTYTVGGTVYRLGPGDAFLIWPDTGITYCADADDPWEYYWVGFSGSDAPAMLAATAFTKECPLIHGSEAPDSSRATAQGAKDPGLSSLQKHIRRIYDARGNTYEAAVRMAGELYLTLAGLIHSADKAEARQPGDFVYVQKAIDYIATNYSYPLTVDSVAAYVGISRSQLFREFKKYTGISPKEYLTDIRIKKACTLLKGTSLSVTEVAYSVGYDDPLYFSKVFSKAKGLSPTHYRE